MQCLSVSLLLDYEGMFARNISCVCLGGKEVSQDSCHQRFLSIKQKNMTNGPTDQRNSQMNRDSRVRDYKEENISSVLFKLSSDNTSHMIKRTGENCVLGKVRGSQNVLC